jgi:hypothetical protein
VNRHLENAFAPHHPRCRAKHRRVLRFSPRNFAGPRTETKQHPTDPSSLAGRFPARPRKGRRRGAERARRAPCVRCGAWRARRRRRRARVRVFSRPRKTTRSHDSVFRRPRSHERRQRNLANIFFLQVACWFFSLFPERSRLVNDLVSEAPRVTSAWSRPPTPKLRVSRRPRGLRSPPPRSKHDLPPRWKGKARPQMQTRLAL